MFVTLTFDPCARLLSYFGIISCLLICGWWFDKCVSINNNTKRFQYNLHVRPFTWYYYNHMQSHYCFNQAINSVFTLWLHEVMSQCLHSVISRGYMSTLWRNVVLIYSLMSCVQPSEILSQRIKSKWITDFLIMSHFNKIVLGTG